MVVVMLVVTVQRLRARRRPGRRRRVDTGLLLSMLLLRLLLRQQRKTHVPRIPGRELVPQDPQLRIGGEKPPVQRAMLRLPEGRRLRFRLR